MKVYKLSMIFIFYCAVVFGQPSEGLIVLDEPDFPFIFELNRGETQVVSRKFKGQEIIRRIKLISFQAFTEPNLWFTEPLDPNNYYQFEVEIEVNEKPVKLYHRPYQMPVTFQGLRIFIENIKQWHESALYGGTGKIEKEVRIAVCAEDEPWGPQYLIFPINEYMWRAAVYNNTWSGLVPFNQLYYHRGEDYGAIPDRLEVVSMVEGVVKSTPVPCDSAIGSNTVMIATDKSFSCKYSHMNIETIRTDYPVGTEIGAGAVIGKTGMTWNGGKNQIMDPHLHIDLSMKQVRLASFPYLMEAYLRKYSDPVIAIAGGYRFAITGQIVELDASRSFAQDGQSVNYRWKLSNGELSGQEKVRIVYERPGIYTEELQVETTDGNTDRDFLYVKVYDPGDNRDFAFGWAYYHPLRGIEPGDEILFWNRLTHTTGEVKINYGDNSAWYPIKEETRYKYDKSGKYVVTLKSSGPENEPVILKMEVVVE